MGGQGAKIGVGERRRRWGPAATAALAAAVVAAGCQAGAAIRVDEAAGGAGSVTVTVTVDRAADAALGGLGPALDTTGLAAAGWQVGAPQPTAGGGESVTAVHPFDTPAQASAVLAGVAGPQVARVALTRRHGLLSTTTSARGVLDLRCGLACFGDSGLRGATGSVVGVDPAALSTTTGTAPADALRVSLTVAVPGAAPVTVRPPLGASAPLAVSATATNAGGVAALAAGALAVVGVAGAVAVRVRRRRRRGGGGRGRSAPVLQAVTTGP